MIKIKEKLKDLICMFDVIGNLCPETDVCFMPDGIHIKAIHPSNHCIVILKIDKNMFEEYDIEGEETYTLNIDLLNKILNISNRNELKLSVAEGKMNIVGMDRSFALKYFVGEPSIRKRPDIVTTSKWNIDSKSFFNVISDLTMFGTNCKMYGNVDLTFHIISDMVEGDIKLNAEMIESDNCYSFYDLTYLNMIKKSEELFDKMSVEFGSETPLIITGKNEHMDFEFILAARME